MNLLLNPIYSNLIKFLTTHYTLNSFRFIEEKRNYYDEVIQSTNSFLKNYFNQTNYKIEFEQLFNEKFRLFKNNYYFLSETLNYCENNLSKDKFEKIEINFKKGLNLTKLLNWYNEINTSSSGPDETDNTIFNNFLFVYLNYFDSWSFPSSGDLIIMDESIDDINVNTSTDLLSLIMYFLIEIKYDDWNLQECYNDLVEFCSKNLDKSYYFKNCVGWSDFSVFLCNISSRLTLYNNIEGSNVCFNLSKIQFETRKKGDLNDEYFLKILNDTKDILEGIKKPRITIKHLRQLNNIKELGIINETKYNSFFKKLNKKKSITTQNSLIQENTLKDYILSKGFIKNLKYENMSDVEQKKIKGYIKTTLKILNDIYNIPGKFEIIFSFEKNHYDITIKSPEIKNEYKNAFYVNHHLEQIKKFVFHRTLSILRSFVLLDQTDILDEMINEVEVLVGVSDKKSSEVYYLKRVIQFLVKCKKMENEESLKVIIDSLKYIKDFYVLPRDRQIDLLLLTNKKLVQTVKTQKFSSIFRELRNTKLHSRFSGEEVFELLGTNNGITNFGLNYYDEIKNGFIEFWNNFKKERKVNFLTYFTKQFSNISKLNENDFNLIRNYIKNDKDFDFWKNLYLKESDIYENNILPYILDVSLTNSIKQEIRKIENIIRESKNIPKVGEGWVSETDLFNTLKTKYSFEIIEFHGKPHWLGRQHLDIYFPALKIGVEYQGSQHQQPVDFFGGEDSFKNQIERDERKRNLCEQNGLKLIYVYEDTNIEEVFKILDVCITSSNLN